MFWQYGFKSNLADYYTASFYSYVCNGAKAFGQSLEKSNCSYKESVAKRTLNEGHPKLQVRECGCFEDKSYFIE